MTTDNDRLETQRFVIFDALMQHCGETLTPDNLEIIRDDILKEMSEGSCAWAFSTDNT